MTHMTSIEAKELPLSLNPFHRQSEVLRRISLMALQPVPKTLGFVGRAALVRCAEAHEAAAEFQQQLLEPEQTTIIEQGEI